MAIQIPDVINSKRRKLTGITSKPLMATMQFIVNNDFIDTTQSPGLSLLTFLRQQLGLCGTKVGCREGDCGACSVLVGALDHKRELTYQVVVSCLMPLANCQGKHIVTIEGINQDNANIIQTAIVEEGASQCGFCTPGIIMSAMSCILSQKQQTIQKFNRALDGNICRCTGYKSINRAVKRIWNSSLQADFPMPVAGLVAAGYLPTYFLDIKQRLADLSSKYIAQDSPVTEDYLLVGGATDLMLQNARHLGDQNTHFVTTESCSSDIRIEDGQCIIAGSTTIERLYDADILKDFFPAFSEYLHLFASTPVRNMATVAGNIANASPIGDLTIILLALNAQLLLEGKGGKRSVPLDRFFLAYKTMDLLQGEQIVEVFFDIPPENSRFTFEKVSKRRILDIATVNSACLLIFNEDKIQSCRISAGGVSAVPCFLEKTSSVLPEILNSNSVLSNILAIAQDEISPISDIRGSEQYKRLLLRQLILAHLQETIKEDKVMEVLTGS